MRKGLEVAIPSALRCAENLELLNVNVASHDSPFAVVNYAINGEKQELGLRFDLDKQVFLDKTGDPCVDDDLQKRAPDIVDLSKTSLTSDMSSLDLLRQVALREQNKVQARMKAFEKLLPENLEATLASPESAEKVQAISMKGFEIFLPEIYLEHLRAALAPTELLAQQMWNDTAQARTAQALYPWLAAEQYVLAITRAALASTESTEKNQTARIKELWQLRLMPLFPVRSAFCRWWAYGRRRCRAAT